MISSKAKYKLSHVTRCSQDNTKHVCKRQAVLHNFFLFAQATTAAILPLQGSAAVSKEECCCSLWLEKNTLRKTPVLYCRFVLYEIVTSSREIEKHTDVTQLLSVVCELPRLAIVLSLSFPVCKIFPNLIKKIFFRRKNPETMFD